MRPGLPHHVVLEVIDGKQNSKGVLVKLEIPFLGCCSDRIRWIGIYLVRFFAAYLSGPMKTAWENATMLGFFVSTHRYPGIPPILAEQMRAVNRLESRLRSGIAIA